MTKRVRNPEALARFKKMTDQELYTALKQAGGSANLAADHLDVGRETLKGRLRALKSDNFRTKQIEKPIKLAAPKKGKRSFIFSSAQNGTDVDERFLDNLEAYAKHLKAPIHISGFTYNKALFEDHSKYVADFHPRVRQYLTNHQYDIDGKVLFCGEMNTQPTADQPLSGFETYTRSKWGIFPHPRVQLQSIATAFHADPKIIMTTGAVTKKNYIQKKAGIKAEFHHVIAAVLVEIDDDGDFFCRHLIAEKDGSFQDLDTRVEGGNISVGFRVEAVTWGDIHAEMLDPEVAIGAWGLDVVDMKSGCQYHDSMIEVLAPKMNFFHDVIDFRARNHHNIDDPHHMFEMWVTGRESVRGEMERVAAFLVGVEWQGQRNLVVDSNHDRALEKWLKRADYRKDPVNATFFLKCQAAKYEAIEKRDETFLVAEFAIRAVQPDVRADFLRNTDTFIICPQNGGGIECALHGDKGANGAKGVVNAFARMGPKSTTADKHGAAIFEGAYQAGHSCKKDMVYNRGGLSSWNHSHIVTYPSGKRAIVTMRKRKWRA